MRKRENVKQRKTMRTFSLHLRVKRKSFSPFARATLRCSLLGIQVGLRSTIHGLFALDTHIQSFFFSCVSLLFNFYFGIIVFAVLLFWSGRLKIFHASSFFSFSLSCSRHSNITRLFVVDFVPEKGTYTHVYICMYAEQKAKGGVLSIDLSYS